MARTVFAQATRAWPASKRATGSAHKLKRGRRGAELQNVGGPGAPLEVPRVQYNTLGMGTDQSHSMLQAFSPSLQISHTTRQSLLRDLLEPGTLNKISSKHKK